MPGYMIVYSTVSDPARFAEYVRAVGPLIASHGGRMLGRSVPPVVLEGTWNWQAATVFEFASVAAVQAFWASPAYAEVHRLRVRAAEFQAIAVGAPG